MSEPFPRPAITAEARSTPEASVVEGSTIASAAVAISTPPTSTDDNETNDATRYNVTNVTDVRRLDDTMLQLVLVLSHPSANTSLFACVLVVAILCMFGYRPPRGQIGNLQAPPHWSPEDRDYTLRQYLEDLAAWVAITRYQPHEIGHVIAS